ncbi:MAG: S-layer homology domain-containing protein [Oscillospiraceae bacterium]|nr:S-layer homology domain-containing protein [Oscillospiraceae bacterium]
MKHISRKITSAALTAALALCLLAATPLTADASPASDLATAISDFDTGVAARLSASANGDVVTVTGHVNGATQQLDLPMPEGVTVVWQALYGGSVPAHGSLVNISGGGEFIVMPGSAINNYENGATLSMLSGTPKLTVNGGQIGVVTSGVAINAGVPGSTIVINGGDIAGGNGTAIYMFCEGANLTINGGIILAESAIAIVGDDATVNVSGGEVKTFRGIALGVDGKNARVSISGGYVGTGSGEEAFALALDGEGAEVHVSGGIISAGKRAAIAINGAGSAVTVNGGFVFAYGTGITGEGNVINIASGAEPVISGEAVVCAWDKKDTQEAPYAGYSSTDLIILPESATVTWHYVYMPTGLVISTVDKTGMRYENGANNGFIIREDVMVSGGNLLVIAFYTGPGSYVEPQYLEEGPEARVARPPDPTRAGYAFAGWYTASTGGELYDFDSVVTSYLNLYARWVEVEENCMANFVETLPYASGQFSDVDEDAWYGLNDQKAVATAYTHKLMQGTGADAFNPLGNVTLAQAITIAARVHAIYSTGDYNYFKEGATWYRVYVDYALEKEIIESGDFADYDRAATRAEMAYIFSRSLPAHEFEAKNTVNSLPDVSAATQYSDAITMLYKAGVVTGDASGAFHPGNNITRAEAAAIISRVILPPLRAEGRTYGEPLPVS